MAKAVERKRLNPVELRDAQITFRNFAGRKKQFNEEGRRNFCVILDNETGANMEADGWRVKYLKPKDEGDTPRPYVQVKVNYTGYKPPAVFMIAGDRMKELTEETVEILDRVDIAYCDMVLNPSYTEAPDGTGGYTAYLNELYAHLAVSRLAQEYAQAYSNEIEEGYVDCGHVCNGDCASCPENV